MRTDNSKAWFLEIKLKNDGSAEVLKENWFPVQWIKKDSFNNKRTARKMFSIQQRQAISLQPAAEGWDTYSSIRFILVLYKISCIRVERAHMDRF